VRSYGHYCALARGLDVIGDRWVLLIVRELLAGGRRYGELVHGLPGIATNLLAERLRTMQADGLVVKTDDDRYQLTERGEDLRGVVLAIIRWAGPLVGRMADSEKYRSHWIVHPITSLFPGEDPTRPEVTVEVRCGEAPMTIRSTGGRVRVQPGHATAPDLVLTGPPDATIGLLAQHIDAGEAKARGVAVTGDARVLRRLRPSLPRSARSGRNRRRSPRPARATTTQQPATELAAGATTAVDPRGRPSLPQR
jgi:DNA-binding HxlR family transcriptional regulator